MNKRVESHYYTPEYTLLAFSKIVDISVVCRLP